MRTDLRQRAVQPLQPDGRAARHLLLRALDRLASGIWFAALASFAIGPPLFVALGTLELMQWWRSAGAAI